MNDASKMIALYIRCWILIRNSVENKILHFVQKVHSLSVDFESGILGPQIKGISIYELMIIIQMRLGGDFYVLAFSYVFTNDSA
jgi:hypothetical protein